MPKVPSNEQLSNIGLDAYDASTNILIDAVSNVLTAPVDGDGYGFRRDACEKFLTSLIGDPEAFAEFVGDNVSVNLEDPLDEAGEYSD